MAEVIQMIKFEHIMKRIITCMVMIFMSITICAQKDISQKNKTNIENKHTMGVRGQSLDTLRNSTF